MKKLLIIILVAIILFFATTLFSGNHFCLPGVVDNGPGSIGCFYSE